jgi:hypothetical protein
MGRTLMPASAAPSANMAAVFTYVRSGTRSTIDPISA